MLQKASSTTAGRGRRPEFDRDAVVLAAISAFWAKGFEATTIAELETATGVDRSTIYNSFGGKTGLYRSAAGAYVDLAAHALFEPLHEGTAGLADIIDFLDRLAANLGSGTNPPGCLIVNDLSADVDHEAANRYLQDLHTGFCAALTRAAASKEVDPHRTDSRTQVLTSAILGINIAHRRATPNTPQAHELIKGLRSEVATWANSARSH